MKIYQSLGLTFGLILISIQPALAGISVGASRIIIYAGESSKAIEINNSSNSQPYLINVDISRDISGESVDTPFVTAPALFRIEPGNTNKIRILKKVNTLPTNRESLFYFNAMAIPSSKVGETQAATSVGGLLQVATGNTIKLFYRPSDFDMTQKEAMGRLQFTHDSRGVKVSNPTPYYISLSKLIIDGKVIKLDVTNGSSMIAPFGDYVYPVNTPRGKVEWKAINDFGGLENFDGTIN